MGPREERDGRGSLSAAAATGSGERTSRELIADSLERSVQASALDNEYRVSQVRAAAYAVVTVLDLGLWLAGKRSPGNIAQTAPVAVISLLAMLFFRRRWYRPWLRFAIPAMDAVFLWVVIENRFATEGESSGLLATAALICGLFASTGGIRFDPRAALWTTFLAVVVSVLLVGRRVSSVHFAYTVTTLAAIGLLNYWLSDRVRHSMEGDRSRTLLRRFLPDVVVTQAFKNPAALLVEPRTVLATILVTDLRGFTALSEKMSPPDLLRALSEIQGELANAVHAHQGVVDKFMGDGMLAVFGAPEPLADHAACAIAAARAIGAAVERLNARGPGHEPIRIGVGVHSGPVVAGCLGTGDRLEFTVIGDTVNIASRLESLTKEMGVSTLVSEETVAASRDAAVKPLGEVTLRGRAQATRVYSLS